MTKTAKIYGDSLYDLAAEEKLTEEILPQMEQVAVLFKENPDYLTLLSEPSIPKTERVGLLDKAFEGQLSLYLLNFLKLLCESGMLREYRDSCRQFKARYNEDHNIAEAVVTTAVALTEAQAQALKERLEKKKRSLSALPVGTVIKWKIGETERVAYKHEAAYQFKRPFWMAMDDSRYYKKTQISNNWEILEENNGEILCNGSRTI